MTPTRLILILLLAAFAVEFALCLVSRLRRLLIAVLAVGSWQLAVGAHPANPIPTYALQQRLAATGQAQAQAMLVARAQVVALSTAQPVVAAVQSVTVTQSPSSAPADFIDLPLGDYPPVPEIYAWTLECSTDLVNWTPMYSWIIGLTPGGSQDVAMNSPHKFYRMEGN